MAEFINECQERLLPEFEQLKTFDVCTNEQLRECIRKHENFYSKITKGEKSVQDYASFIMFTKKMHKWVSEKEHLHGKKMSGLKASIATRIIRLYRDGLRQFPNEERFWESFLTFSKKSVPHEVMGIYEKMLTLHGDKPSVWCDAAIWVFGYSANIIKIKEIFFRALHRHPTSEIINKTFFDMLLIDASKMSAERILNNNTVSEQDIGLEFVELVYKNSRKNISNISFYLSLLEQCEEKEFLNMTAPLQKQILDDLMDLYPREEILWNALAQRELRGLNMSDLIRMSKKEKPRTSAHQLSSDSDSDDNNDAADGTGETNTDDRILDGKVVKNTNSIWHNRTLKRRIILCCNVYETGVKTLKTTKMWSLYINALMEINQETSTLLPFKQKKLFYALKNGHQSGLLSVEHYCAFTNILLECDGGALIAESILNEAVKIHDSVKLYEIWIKICIAENNEVKVQKILRTAYEKLGSDSVPIWEHALTYYVHNALRYETQLKDLFKEVCNQMDPKFSVFRVQYLQYCSLTRPISEVRPIYDEMCQLPPPYLELHKKNGFT